MPNKKTGRQAGFSTTLIVVVIIFVAVAVFAWYASTHMSQNPDDTLTTTPPVNTAAEKAAIKSRLTEIMNFSPANAKTSHLETVRAKGYLTDQFYALAKSVTDHDPLTCTQDAPSSFTNNDPVLTGASNDATQIVDEKFATATHSVTYHWHKTSPTAGWQVSSVICSAS